MAVVAIIAAGDVTLVLAGGCEAIVAGSATAKNLGVINIRRRNEGVRGMAVLAGTG